MFVCVVSFRSFRVTGGAVLVVDRVLEVRAFRGSAALRPCKGEGW